MLVEVYNSWVGFRVAASMKLILPTFSSVFPYYQGESTFLIMGFSSNTNLIQIIYQT